MSSWDFNNIIDRLRQWWQHLSGHKQEAPADADYADFLVAVFVALRHSGMVLGVGELHAVLRIATEYWNGDKEEELKALVQLVWCHSSPEEQAFEQVWAEVFAVSGTDEPSDIGRDKPEPEPLPKHTPTPNKGKPDRQSVEEQTPAPPEKPPRWEPLPFQVPFTPALIDDRFELGNYWPISRRQMVYAWRYLRRPLADGPQDVLDIAATVEQTTQHGLFLGPVYRRRERNHAHLLLLIDQNGSMVPFHRFTRDLVETACHESTIEQVDGYYFHNVLAESVYTDPHMTEPVKLAHVLAHCTTDTSVLLVSDAGAARGYRRLERIRATSTVLRQVERSTPLVAWLNPMPEERWSGSSAQIIANLLHGRMFQMDPDGFSRAIDVVRGQPFRRDY